MASTTVDMSKTYLDWAKRNLALNGLAGPQHGFVHAGALASLADSACGYAALSLMPADAAVLSVEFKCNMLSPAKGEAVLTYRVRVVW